MTESDQIKAIAELDGLDPKKVGSNWDSKIQAYRDGPNDFYWSADDGSMEVIHLRYLTSYDAIIPVINKWCGAYVYRHELFMDVCRKIVKGIGTTFYVMSPSQLCEALLRATGKWTE